MSYFPYPSSSTIDLRDELSALLYGDQLDPGIGRKVLIRRLTDRKCACQTEKGSADSNCAYCRGEGWLWTETLNTVYIVRNFGSVLNPSNVIKNQNVTAPYGYTDENRALAYAEYTVFPNYERYLRPDHPSFDQLYELKVDENGNLIRPVVRVAKWAIKSVTPHQGDGGRIEFFELGLEKQNI